MAHISFTDKGIKSFVIYDKTNKTLSSTIEKIIELCNPSISSTNNDKRRRKTTSISPAPYTNTIFVVMNGFGLGSQPMENFHSLFSSLNKVLDENNSYVCFLRGCGDNPLLFNGKQPFADGRIMAIPDYSLLSIKDFTCLCIGGGSSVDKQWKLSNEKVTGQKEFYEDELPFYDEKMLDEVINGNQIHAVCTYESPTFMLPSISCISKMPWFEGNNELLHKQIQTSGIIDQIYCNLMQKMKMPSTWMCANHLFDLPDSFTLCGTCFMFAPVNIPNALYVEGSRDEILSRVLSKVSLGTSSTRVGPTWFAPTYTDMMFAENN